MSTPSIPPVRTRPERTCIGCRAIRPKAELLRLMLPAGDERSSVSVDTGGRRSGRGAYLCRATAADCLTRARRRRALTRALRTTADHVDAEALAAAVTTAATATATAAECGTTPSPPGVAGGGSLPTSEVSSSPR